jgi:hypothetical protein
MGRRKLDVLANSVEVVNLDEDAISYCLVRMRLAICFSPFRPPFTRTIFCIFLGGRESSGSRRRLDATARTLTSLSTPTLVPSPDPTLQPLTTRGGGGWGGLGNRARYTPRPAAFAANAKRKKILW